MTTAALYLRVSLDSTGEELAIKRQREDCLRLAAARGWQVVEEYVDNSLSASDHRKARSAMAFRSSMSAATELRNRERVLGTTAEYRRDLRIRYVEPRPALAVAPVAEEDFSDL